MTYYVPGTQEKDPSKVIMSLQQVHEKTATNTTDIATNTADIATNTSAIAAMQAAWTAYTPTISSTTGTITTASGSGRYLAIGKTVFITVSITVTTNGTGATAVRATLPVNAKNSLNHTLVGRENSATGKMLQARILTGANTVMDVLNYDNTYPGVDGALFNITGVYEAA